MFRKVLSIALVFVCFSSTVLANFDFNSNCIHAYKSILALRLNEGRLLIDKEKALHPQNAITTLLDNYYDFFLILTNENKAEFGKLKENKSIRINRLEDEDPNSPYYNFCIAQVNLQWALLHSHFGEYTTAGLEVNRAYRLLQSNNKKYPAFLPNGIPLGVVNVLLGSLPGGALKSILSFLGIKGDTQTGVKMLEQLSVDLPKSPYSYHYNELIYYLTYIQTDVVNNPFAYSKMLQMVTVADSTSLLTDYIRGYVALRTGHSAEAIGWLQNRHQGSDYLPYPYLDYLIGIAKMNREDTGANNYFYKFLQSNTGVNFIKDAYLHLAWKCLLEGDIHRYNGFIQFVKAKGYLFNDKDKQALDEANDTAPNLFLLRARLLCDGGFYARALAALKGKTVADFSLERDRIEYYYRLGRIYDAMNEDDTALKFYQNAINIGKNSNYHYAATSAIKMGVIYEEQNQPVKAREAYHHVFDFKNQQFKNSLEQKAKEGLKRLAAN
ncbi:tetratricopeptide repeat protein [Mucilaginibacter gracilis]|uniref:Tetratricopeptide repeat protein n=1 Tax=Mucilaginibacter gracilis TaxID=423350 RepID=A0A495IWU9_9SPHI|nr:tetratricopeptide repeat protein [Mucilaginibacter gracilis]RKR81150.1 tetratricopeptide repeat protein [Mucilaginibacter gracilis]